MSAIIHQSHRKQWQKSNRVGRTEVGGEVSRNSATRGDHLTFCMSHDFNPLTAAAAQPRLPRQSIWMSSHTQCNIRKRRYYHAIRSYCMNFLDDNRITSKLGNFSKPVSSAVFCTGGVSTGTCIFLNSRIFPVARPTLSASPEASRVGSSGNGAEG